MHAYQCLQRHHIHPTGGRVRNREDDTEGERGGLREREEEEQRESLKDKETE